MNVIVDVDVDVIGPLIVAALVSGNDTVDVIVAVDVDVIGPLIVAALVSGNDTVDVIDHRGQRGSISFLSSQSSNSITRWCEAASIAEPLAIDRSHPPVA